MTDAHAEEQQASPISYQEFIQQVEITRIWLKSSKVFNADREDVSGGIDVQIADTSHWVAIDTGFTAHHKYVIKFRDQRKHRLGDVEVEFGLTYQSPEPMTDEIYDLFGEHNLPLNSWPYLREYLSSTLSRMGWPPFTLPARKISLG